MQVDLYIARNTVVMCCCYACIVSYCMQTVCVMCVSELDLDGDGRVSFRDFEFAMKYNVDDHF